MASSAKAPPAESTGGVVELRRFLLRFGISSLLFNAAAAVIAADRFRIPDGVDVKPFLPVAFAPLPRLSFLRVCDILHVDESHTQLQMKDS